MYIWDITRTYLHKWAIREHIKSHMSLVVSPSTITSVWIPSFVCENVPYVVYPVIENNATTIYTHLVILEKKTRNLAMNKLKIVCNDLFLSAKTTGN